MHGDRVGVDGPGATPRLRLIGAALLASTALARPLAALAQNAGAPTVATTAPTVGEVVVTAEKRTENIQHVPESIQALDTRKLTQLNVTNFQDYVKFTPSVTFQTLAPSQTTIYMRGVSSGDNANHSGPLPSVGTYLDEQPITTIGGTLDVHVYDMARIEVLPGPQGTLFGASSQAGTLRLITNPPSTKGFSAGYDLEGNTIDHGSQGYVAEGFVNVPINDKVAIRLVAFDERDGGYIDNVPGTRTFATSGDTINNSAEVEKNFNPTETYGGRAALKIDLDENWTVTPTLVAQDQRYRGVFGYEPSVGDLEVQRFQPDRFHDQWYQAGLTVNGKIGNYDLVYSGGYFQRRIDSISDYTDYSIFYDALDGSGAYWTDNNGDVIGNPQQRIVGKDQFSKRSNEIRILSPVTDRFHFIAGLFEERQTHYIVQDYQIPGFGTDISVTGWPGTIWLTDQERIDRDVAAFGEGTFDITPKLSLTAGVREYYYDNTLGGFYGYSGNYSSHTGESQCFSNSNYHGEPCEDLNKVVADSGETHKVNLTYRFDSQRLVYFTYSTGYRPGGVNRNGSLPNYAADSLSNYEIGAKTSWFDRRLVVDIAAYYEDWQKFQFSFLGLNSLTVVENAPSADIKGVEGTIDWAATNQLTVSGGFSYNDARLSQNFCGADPTTGNIIASCSAADSVAPKNSVLPYTPPFKGNLTGRYTFDLMGWAAHAQASVVYQTKTQVGLRTTDKEYLGFMPDYTTADFSFGVEKHGVSLEAFIKNAFDSRGQENRYTECTVNVCAANVAGIPQAVYAVPITPMTIGIRVGQRF